MRERELHNCFYTGSLANHTTIFKSFTNHTPGLHFSTKKLTKFLTHTKI